MKLDPPAPPLNIGDRWVELKKEIMKLARAESKSIKAARRQETSMLDVTIDQLQALASTGHAEPDDLIALGKARLQRRDARQAAASLYATTEEFAVNGSAS